MDVRRRDIFDVLRSSLTDHPTCGSGENQMRYKLVIDDIGDGFVMHLLVSFGVLQRKNTRMYILSDFPEDAHLQEVWDYSCVVKINPLVPKITQVYIQCCGISLFSIQKSQTFR